ncbi:MAG: alpha/beta hydrolase-fold protein, partial [SAR324 cluster bacterium]|nr:alpha/beta hydrolase-fold protein [SAR324 cluster bacterium]
MVKLEKIGESKSFGGWTRILQHDSKSCSCIMKFSAFLPPQIENGPVPVLTWLSGLTCTHENFITKAGAQKFAAEHGLMLVAPDTSPRGVGIQGEDDS